MKHEEKKPIAFRIIKGCIRAFYPRMTVEGAENLPNEPCLIVANHCQMNGPIVGELYVPHDPYIWCAGEMMRREDVPKYAFTDFWSQKPRWAHPFFKLLAHLITPFAVCVFNNARTIGVYHDARIMTTFKTTAKTLEAGDSVLIFPEYDEKHNQILYAFRDRFIDVAKLYHKKTGREIAFVPMYIAPRLKTLTIGKPIRFLAAEPIEKERERIRRCLMEEITAIAEAMPKHTVVPYRNIPKKEYPSNVPAPEKTDR